MNSFLFRSKPHNVTAHYLNKKVQKNELQDALSNQCVTYFLIRILVYDDNIKKGSRGLYGRLRS